MTNRRCSAVALLTLMAACQSERPAPSGNPPAAAAVFHSAAGRYRFAIPIEWAGHYTVDTVLGTDPLAEHAGIRHMVSFTYLPTDTTIHAPPLLVLISLPRADWDRMRSADDIPRGEVVAEREGEVVVAGLTPSNPYDSLSSDGPRFAALRRTAAQIRQAITLE